MKILINTPRLVPHGGVANHYIGLRDYWNEEVIYNPIGKKGSKSGSGIYRLPLNIISYIYKIFTFSPDIILLNPSLSKSAMTRDLIFLRIAKILNRKVVVFIHGFDKNSIEKLNLKSTVKDLNKCESILVLAQEFADILKLWGVKVPIHLTTTKVNDKLIENLNIEEKKYKIENILFLARVTKEKGIFVTLDTYKILKGKYSNINLRVVGDGPALEEAKSIAAKEELKDVVFTGTLSGEALINEFTNADLYFFPSYHHEGMPTSVLEAMAFGLPIVSRPVGGVCDFFENGKMGYLVDSLSPSDFAYAIETMIKEKEKLKEISYHNHKYAKEHFLASSVAKSLEEILRQYI